MNNTTTPCPECNNIRRHKDACKYGELQTELEAAKKQLEELKRDKERLDWLDENRTAHIYGHFKYNTSNAAIQKTWRLAIDNAMKEGK